MTQWSLRQLVSTLLPSGIIGVSVALAPPAQAAARSDPALSTETAAMPVAARLQSIRDAVSAVARDEAAAEGQPGRAPNILKTWWHNGWGNGGWHPNWGNGGWRPAWGNGGWGPAWGNGWRNGGWGNWHGRWRW